MAFINIMEIIYPVGSIYISINSTSPASTIGGSWTGIIDRCLVGAGSAFTVNATGGEINHTLTKNEMPTHGHTGNDGQNWDLEVSRGFNSGAYNCIGGNNFQTNSSTLQGGGLRTTICNPIMPSISGRGLLNIFCEEGGF